ncbi:MAG TPA: SDR family NAD(P)-dependent oxidoreductase [Actinomycetota bacterium]|nr:SDR family NAD(P)-dependent oxidoreductase [Actinomycetota bacterium]
MSDEPPLRVVITGASSGIGLAAATALARGGAAVTMVGHDPAKSASALAAVKSAAPEAAVDLLVADLSAQAEVARLAALLLDRADRGERIDVLANNAGALFAHRQLTADGIEATWALNHLAPFLLTNLLLEQLKRHPPARIITTASDAHRKERLPFDDLNAARKYKGFARYGQTKLANIAFTFELARRLEGSRVTANCFHPGLVATGFNRNNGRRATWMMNAVKPFSTTPEKAADTLVWLATSPEAAAENGGYFFGRRRIEPNAQAQDPAVWQRLWEVSRSQTGLGVPA